MIPDLKYSQFNSYSILIEWKAIIDENVLEDVLRFKLCIEKEYIKEKVEVISTYNSILIVYNISIENVNTKISNLKALYSKLDKVKTLNTSTWKIPVCYHDDFATDLEGFSNKKKLSKAEIIKLHSGTIYTVFFIGFLPGFLYLGGLDSKLHFDRKITPNLNVKKGSVAIGGEQTGIYPQDSPGGWHIIGNSPIALFDSNSNPPCFIKAGDKIQFHPVSILEYSAIKESVEASKFNLSSLLV
ncbi:3-methyl-2-oxobutanoate hydroxymethyltransferase [Flavobacteriales bacterium ALC-1]|nr:3-methyl-2-oxobutanoate hydroxymethyltransferase [Flavobacteriales bacterium ALC-1]